MPDCQLCGNYTTRRKQLIVYNDDDIKLAETYALACTSCYNECVTAFHKEQNAVKRKQINAICKLRKTEALYADDAYIRLKQKLIAKLPRPPRVIPK